MQSHSLQFCSVKFCTALLMLIALLFIDCLFTEPLQIMLTCFFTVINWQAFLFDVNILLLVACKYIFKSKYFSQFLSACLCCSFPPLEYLIFVTEFLEKKYVREGSKLVKILLLFWCLIHIISIYFHISKLDFRILVCMRNMRSKISTMFTL